MKITSPLANTCDKDRQLSEPLPKELREKTHKKRKKREESETALRPSNEHSPKTGQTEDKHFRSNLSGNEKSVGESESAVLFSNDQIDLTSEWALLNTRFDLCPKFTFVSHRSYSFSSESLFLIDQQK
nr:hypothetical protein BgiMline_012354 [Biomphalaria glabrata]